MELYVIAGIGVLVAGWLWARRGPSPYAAAREAAERDDIAPIVKAAEPLPVQARSAFYEQAIATLWEGWHRPLAIRMVREYTIGCPEDKVCQFWLQRSMEVEPDAARKVFDDGFLNQYFKPDVAKACHSGSS